MAIIAVKAVVSGRVQGVNFRYATQIAALRIGEITGWVRNLATGQVEVWMEGDEDEVDELAAWLHEGPPAARVDEVRLERFSPTGEYKDFQVRR